MKFFWPAACALILLALLSSAALYSGLPPIMATHWNAANQANGSMQKEWAVLLMPAIMLILAFFLYYLPSLDPLHSNIESFKTPYQHFILILLAFFAIIHVQILLWNSGLLLPPSITVSVGLAVLLFYAGRLCEASKRNYFIGIRTPWALHDERVWDETNQFGGRLFQLLSPLALFGAFYPNQYLPIIIVAALLPAVAAVIYSYTVYRKLHNKEKRSLSKTSSRAGQRSKRRR